uniref:Olfactory receptor OR12 n=1 Tax=Oedaleus asiaticus TaxID=244712 RepID=A0A410HWM5_9ORTH|nr:olfactory receptor OR12 [Oedaleus asiaticus]
MVSLLQTIMDYSVSILLLTNVLDMCFLIFTMSELLHHEKSLHAVLQTILSLPCLLCESGAFCMFGQMIIDQSENLVHAAFSCEWLEADSRFRRPLYTFMLMATRPLQIKLGGTAKLSRSTFLQALNGSYSLINLLYHSRRPVG